MIEFYVNLLAIFNAVGMTLVAMVLERGAIILAFYCMDQVTEDISTAHIRKLE